MNKKIVSMLMVGTMALTMLAGCGSGKGSGADGSSDGGDSKKATKEITYWSMWNSTEPQAKVIQEAADAYEKESGVHVNIEWKGRDIKTLIGTALEAGEKIDLFDDDYQRVVSNTKEYLADLTDMADKVDFESHVMPVILDKAKSWGDGKLYTVPYQVYTTGVWYDKTMWEKAGLTDADKPETFEDLKAVCQKLKDSGVNPITCNSDTVNLLYGFQLGRYIGQEALLDCYNNANWANVPEAKKAADDIQSLVDAGYFSPNAPANYPDGQNEIGFGESAMILNASWIPNEILTKTGTEVDFGFFPWPSVEGGVDGAEASMVGAQGFGVVAKSENQQEAFDFATMIATGDYDLKMAEAVNSIPADTANTEWPAAIADAEPYFKEMTKAYDWAVGLETNSDIAPIVNENIVKLIKGEVTSDEFISALSTAK
ncbi:MAG TPA: extracellular solute-binding protein [Candidatus Blautia stercoravium]|nr:extracellular solute-binding protein [Candidatus Blautia stercoravium]